LQKGFPGACQRRDFFCRPPDGNSVTNSARLSGIVERDATD
jgi:hypothetical protein